MSFFSVLGFSIGASAAERKLNELFEYYQVALDDQRVKSIGRISKWEEKTVDNIKRHASNLKTLLEQQYDTQIRSVKETKKNYLSMIDEHENIGDEQAVRSLLGQCTLLKFELAQIEYHPCSIDFIQLVSKDSEIINSKVNKPYKSQTKFSAENLSDINDPLKESPTGHFSAESTICDSYDDDSDFKKCPVCFMIYPFDMAIQTRIDHVQSHYTDDRQTDPMQS
ncbi:unnamed protein product [Adineta ricciae]|uniref:Uncharacterized protein n=1 Tax=Adineta ricciae TaxID=249248 RepID=A0A816EPG6_ADIRI|nr:unnamed protein product [Adineta ricciae]CAF1655756.1 unnamed protein product [Adineta ricciae]